ncbi:MAG: hypothetical protein PHW76_02035 [Alphaproteobacteria bacterium]|nr:hypothetical protein [Alphaproteobacteria bacterium]
MVVEGTDKRLSPNAGIAIGPILFIIAILGILAAAIAAGSGTFMGSTTAESNKTKSAALIQIGENLKLGMDQIIMENGISPNDVNTSYSATDSNSGLFSPTGGGIAQPSPGMANDPRVDRWYFVRGDVVGFGTGNDVVMAVLPVKLGVCTEVNNRVMGTSGVPTGNFGDFAANTVTSDAWPDTGASWGLSDGTSTTMSTPSLRGIATGCIQNTGVEVNTTTGPSSDYFFYQVLAIQ